MKLTEKELEVFKAVCQENVEMTFFSDVRKRIKSNGIDMGVPEIRGVVGSLVKKGLLEVFELSENDYEINGTQDAYKLRRELNL